MRCLIAVLAIGIFCLAAKGVTAADPQPIDLELVLAVDNSLSVNAREFALQINGIAEAFRHPDVVAVVLSHDGMVVSFVLWSNHQQQETGVAWHHLKDAASITDFAAKVAEVSRIDVSGGTGIGSAMAYALRLLGKNAFDGERRVIDVSGDGQNNMGVVPSTIRDRAVVLGITINGLAILDEEPRLDQYYLANVIGGPGAFLEIAEDFDTFSTTIRRKLLREIGGRSLVLYR